MAAADNKIPKELADLVEAARPPCPFYKKRKGGCRKGVKCPLRHWDTTPAEYLVPHVSRVPMEDGSTRCGIWFCFVSEEVLKKQRPWHDKQNSCLSRNVLI